MIVFVDCESLTFVVRHRCESVVVLHKSDVSDVQGRRYNSETLETQLVVQTDHFHRILWGGGTNSQSLSFDFDATLSNQCFGKCAFVICAFGLEAIRAVQIVEIVRRGQAQ